MVGESVLCIIHALSHAPRLETSCNHYSSHPARISTADSATIVTMTLSASPMAPRSVHPAARASSTCYAQHPSSGQRLSLTVPRSCTSPTSHSSPHSSTSGAAVESSRQVSPRLVTQPILPFSLLQVRVLIESPERNWLSIILPLRYTLRWFCRPSLVIRVPRGQGC